MRFILGLSPQEIAREEIIEETGYSPTLEYGTIFRLLQTILIFIH